MEANEEERIPQGELIYYSFKLNPAFKELYYLVISDAHYGNPLFSQHHFIRTLEFLKKPNAYGFLNGDLCESTLRTSKGEIYKQVGSPEDQRDQIIEWLMPYRNKLLGIIDGNHEERIWKEAGIHICKDIAKALSIPFDPEGMLLKISFGDKNKRMEGKPFVFWHYTQHGYGGARTKSGKAVKVERMGTWVHADLYTMSHDHVVNAAPDVYLMQDPRTRPQLDKHSKPTGFIIGKVKAHTKKLVKTNAYLKWGGYAEMYGFPPVDLETPMIRLLTPYSKHWEELPEKPKQAVKVEV